MKPPAYQTLQPGQAGRPIRPLLPGQAVTASQFNALAHQATAVGIENQQFQPGSGRAPATIHFLQGTADFPAVNGTFGVDVFPGESYEVWGYHLTSTGSGTYSVQLQIDGVGKGPVITSTGTKDETVILDEADRVVYKDDATITLGVIATSGTVTNFALVFRCWIIA